MKLNLESSQKRGKTNNDVPVGTYRSNGSANGSIVFKGKRADYIMKAPERIESTLHVGLNRALMNVKYFDQLMICITIKKRLKKLAIQGMLIHNVDFCRFCWDPNYRITWKYGYNEVTGGIQKQFVINEFRYIQIRENNYNKS
ncbi:hypothetical protein BpHYR1_049091 [Brachionus plicatilis]|uniref:Uncharacterized protein n=1 Tax=Brachionus plicatilis TaxID=10195 RepID=A0A3M7R6Z9_BRAPC|nr:hypothetical protein BpHYR1_049091 [Brachionus plicatilis]